MDKKLIEFGNKVKKNLEEYYNGDVMVRINEVMKNNGLELLGISMVSEKSNLSPTIYMEPFYDKYKNGTPFAEVFRMITTQYEECRKEEHMNMEFFGNYEKVRGRIAFKLINYEMNLKLLSDIPHIKFYDLAIVFYYVVECNLLGNATILIHNNHVDTWNISEAVLYKDAMHNTQSMMPYRIESLTELLIEMMKSNISEGDADIDSIIEEQLEGTKDMPLYVLSNNLKQFGAACMAYDGMLKKIADTLDSDYVILPSSVHELIIVPVSSKDVDYEWLKNMVTEVNSTQLQLEEILSDSVYRYNRSTEKLTVMYSKGSNPTAVKLDKEYAL